MCKIDFPEFKNKVAVVTGATGHIGRVFCNKFASYGGVCVLVDQDILRLETLREELLRHSSCRHFLYQADFTDEFSLDAFIEKVKMDLCRVDILLNNAAYTGDKNIDGWAVEFSSQRQEPWAKAMDVNLNSAFRISQQLVPLLSNADLPTIINLASIYGFVGPDFGLYKGTKMGNPAAYAVSKGGLLQLTKWLSTALAPHIRVNAVSPGGLLRDQPNTFIQRYIARTPLQRMASEDDVVNAVLFLASSMSSYITGQNIIVDGGFSTL